MKEEFTVSKGDDIREILVAFAVSVMDLCDRLPKTTAGMHIADQLLRSATSAAPNYAEARGAESARDFVHKLGIVLKELNESEVWIDMLVRRKMAEDQPILKIQEECRSLLRIIAASMRTTNKSLGRTGGSKNARARLSVRLFCVASIDPQLWIVDPPSTIGQYREQEHGYAYNHRTARGGRNQGILLETIGFPPPDRCPQ